MPGPETQARGRARVAPALARRHPLEWGRGQVTLVRQQPQEWGRKIRPPAEIQASTPSRAIRTFSLPRRRGRGRQPRPHEMQGLATRIMACRSVPSGAARARRTKWPLAERHPETDPGRQHRPKETPTLVQKVCQEEARAFRTRSAFRALHELETRCWMLRRRSRDGRLSPPDAFQVGQNWVCRRGKPLSGSL
jgi:hypothetical protein